MNRPLLEQQLSALPLVQYEFFPTEELPFSPKVRQICAQECPRYNRTWSCPPAVGTVEACRERCLSYPDALLLVTMAEVGDAADMAQTLPTRLEHEALTRRVRGYLEEQSCETLALSAESCALCPDCTWPDGPCRHPGEMLPCVESHAILVTALAERFGIDFLAGNNLVTWFSLILYRDKAN